MQENHSNDIPLEARKRKLLAEGALLRIGIMEARASVRASLTPESLAKGAMNRLAAAVTSAFGGVFSGNAAGGKLQSLQSLSPLLIGAVSLLSKRYFRKPILYCSVISATAACAYYLTRKRDREQRPVDGEDNDEVSTPDGE